MRRYCFLLRKIIFVRFSRVLLLYWTCVCFVGDVVDRHRLRRRCSRALQRNVRRFCYHEMSRVDDKQKYKSNAIFVGRVCGVRLCVNN